MNKPYKNTRIKITLFTVFLALSLCSVSLYSATPSYSNFSSNQFAPSGTYTVTVKSKALLTNTVFMGVGTPAVELHGGFLSTNDTTGSLTILSNSSLVLSNGATANSVAITNAGGIMNLEGGPRGTVLQFRFNTSGAPVMVISNGLVGIGIGSPLQALDVVGIIKSSGDVQCGSIVSAVQNVACGASQFFNFAGSSRAYSPVNGVWRFTTSTQTGGSILLPNVSSTFISGQETGTNTVIESDGNALHISDSLIIHSNVFPITANFANMAPCSCVTWMSNFTCYMICTNSAAGNATTNKLGGL